MAKTGAKTIGGMTYRTVDKVPKHSRSWAAAALRDFLETGEKVIALDFPDARKATMKKQALDKQIKDEESEFYGKVKVTRQTQTLYFELV